MAEADDLPFSSSPSQVSDSGLTSSSLGLHTNQDTRSAADFDTIKASSIGIAGGRRSRPSSGFFFADDEDSTLKQESASVTSDWSLTGLEDYVPVASPPHGPFTGQTTHGPGYRMSSTPLFPSPLAQATSVDGDGEEVDEDTIESLAWSESQEAALNVDKTREPLLIRPPASAAAAMSTKDKIRIGSPLRHVAQLAPEDESELLPTTQPNEAGQPSALGLSTTISAPPPAHFQRHRTVYNPTPIVGLDTTHGMEAFPATIPRQSSPLGLRKPIPGPVQERRRTSGTFRPPGSSPGGVQSIPLPVPSPTTVVATLGSHSRQGSISSVSASVVSASGSNASRRNSLAFNSSPTRNSTSRSTLSVALAANAMQAPPVPPFEAIKLQRVPTAVRIAHDLRPVSQPTSPTNTFAPRPLPLRDSPLPPPTPNATRAGSPADSSSDSSRGAERRSRHGTEAGWSSGISSLASPITLPCSVPTTAAEPSAFSPVFPFVNTHAPLKPGRSARDRSKSVFSTTDSMTSDDFSSASPISAQASPTQARYGHTSLPATGRSLPSLGHAPTSQPTYFHVPGRAVSISSLPTPHPSDNADAKSKLSTSMSERNGLSHHRTSVIPSHGPSTDEVAKVILQSRHAKVNKWKRPSAEGGLSLGTSTGSLGNIDGSRLGGVGIEKRKGLPDFAKETCLSPLDSMSSSSPGLGHMAFARASETDLIGIEDRDLSDAAFAGLVDVTGPGKEIEWVDWLDDYRRMKEAKLKQQGADRVDKGKQRELNSSTSLVPPPSDMGDESVMDVESECPTTEAVTQPPSPVIGFSASAGRTSHGDDAEHILVPSSPAVQPLATQDSIRGEIGPSKGSQAAGLSPSAAIRSDYSMTSSEAGLRQRKPSAASMLSRAHTAFEVASLDSHQDPASTDLPPMDSASPRRLLHSNSGKRRKKMNLGRRIDEWWTAVRSSFTGEDSRNSQVASGSSSLRSSVRSLERRGQQQIQEQRKMVLRGSASVVDIKQEQTEDKGDVAQSTSLRPNDVLQQSQLPAELHLIPPTIPERTQSSKSLSSNGSNEVTTKAEGRRRNPNLTLKLDSISPTDFSDVFRAMQVKDKGAVTASSEPTRPASKMLGSDTSVRMAHLGLIPRTEATPSLTPNGQKLWDKTPGLISGNPFQHNARSHPESARPLERKDSDPAEATFSMHTIQQHIRQRLTTAKLSCDKELKVIIGEITSFVEAETRALREQDRIQQEEESGAVESEVGEGDGDEDVDGRRGSRPRRLSLSRTLSVPSPSGLLAAPDRHKFGGSGASDSDPSSVSTSAPISRRGSGQGHGRGRVMGSRRRPSVATKMHLSSNPKSNDLATAARSVSLSGSSVYHSESNASSRSTSRSRSPMPPTTSGKNSPAITAQQHLSAEPSNLALSSETSTVAPGSDEAFYASPFVASLQEICSIATEIVNSSIGTLAAKPHALANVIHRIQAIGKAWDQHQDWPSRSWYVRLLLSIAGLSRVLEWWEAEKGFWAFAPEDDDDSEEIRFVAQGQGDEDEHDMQVVPQAEFGVSGSSGQKRLEESGIVSSRAASPRHAPVDQLAVTTPKSAIMEGQVVETDFKAAIESARTETVLAEVSLDDAEILYLSPGWTKVTGLDPQEVLGAPFGALVDQNPNLFNEAHTRLLEDIGNTVELQFTIKISLPPDDSEDQDPQASGDHFFPMTGKGMLMVDRVSGEPLHSMWVLRLALRKPSDDALPIGPKTGSVHGRSLSNPVAPVFAPEPFSTAPLLCRICEHHIPTYYFERHNETCAETHRLEEQIGLINERLTELRDVVRELHVGLEKSQPPPDLQYSGSYLLTTYSPSPLSPLNPSRVTLLPQQAAIRAAQKSSIESIDQLVLTALDISTPAAGDEGQVSQLEAVRLLSPRSEDLLMFVGKWSFDRIEDPALAMLANDTLMAAQQKARVVSRMRNTILYAERIRLEWEAKVQAALVAHSKRSGDSSSPLIGVDEISRPKSAPPIEDTSFLQGSSGESFRRSASAQGVNASMHELQKQPHSTVTSPELQLVMTDLKALGIPHPHPIPAARFSTPPRSPNVSHASPHESRRGSGNNPNESSFQDGPLSPRIPSTIPAKIKTGASIKDFDMIKPISKGAFGQVWLTKKKTTGDYYAVKILKKQDMISKNQISNVKSERKILMNQSDSDFTVKLFYTFSSRDHLYLVMEYLNGGDCAALVKTIGALPEDWTRQYIAEVTLGLEYLHGTGVIHRDLKPDNLLIDQYGHLKLTDFGLSKIGLLGRQTGGHRQPWGLSSSTREGRRNQTLSPFGFGQPQSEGSSPDSTPGTGLMSLHASYFLPAGQKEAETRETPSESSGKPSEAFFKAKTQPYSSFASALDSQPGTSTARTPDTGKAFFGTPDYLAPETILGVEMGETVDWWALGVICYEFIHGVPPFNAETPEKVFANIIQHRLEFLDEDISPEARDLIEQLLTPDPMQRLGLHGAGEVKAHAFFESVDWNRVLKNEPSFVPRLDDPEATDYFDPRGATELVFRDEDHSPAASDPTSLQTETALTRSTRDRSETEPASFAVAADDFGTFNFKNVPVLERANEEVIRRLRDQAHDRPSRHARHMSFGGVMKPVPGSPAESSSSSSAAPQFTGSTMPTAPVSTWHSPSHTRNPSEAQPLKLPITTSVEDSRRNSLPSRLRRVSSFAGVDSTPPGTSPTHSSPRETRRTMIGDMVSSAPVPASTASSPGIPLKRLPPMNNPPTSMMAPASERTLDCLIAEDNPISSKILETILARLGCRCVVAPNGEEAVSLATANIRFDVIFMDLLMPLIEGQDAARLIKSTQNANMRTPIIAVTSFESFVSEQGTLFAAVLAKPVQKTDVLMILKKLGFVAKQAKGRKESIGMTSSGAAVSGSVASESPATSRVTTMTEVPVEEPLRRVVTSN